MYKPETAKDCWLCQKPREKHGTGSPLWPHQHLDFSLDLQNCERITFCCFKLPSLWYYTLCQQPQEMNTAHTELISLTSSKWNLIFLKKWCCDGSFHSWLNFSYKWLKFRISGISYETTLRCIYQLIRHCFRITDYIRLCLLWYSMRANTTQCLPYFETHCYYHQHHYFFFLQK